MVWLCQDIYGLVLILFFFVGKRGSRDIFQIFKEVLLPISPIHLSIYTSISETCLIHFLVVQIMSSVISGIIIDSFGELRNNHTQIEDERENRCFICSYSRDFFESRARIGWVGSICTHAHHVVAKISRLAICSIPHQLISDLKNTKKKNILFGTTCTLFSIWSVCTKMSKFTSMGL